MVSFAPQPHPQPNEPQLQFQLEHPQPQPKNPNPEDPFDILDAQATDFTLADSFLDFDSMQAWFEDNKPMPSLDMATQEENNNKDKDKDNNNNGLARATPSSLQVEQGIANGSDPYAAGSTHAVKGETPEPECENLGTSGCAIEQGMEKISLVSGCGSSVRMEGNGIIKAEVITNDEDKDEGESEGSDSESAGTSSSSTSCESSSGTGSDSEDEDDNNEEEEDEQHVVDEEVEDGEIRGFGAQEMVTETAAVDDDVDDDDSEDAETTATWINDDDDVVGDDDEEDGNNAARRPIKSKNELEILPSVPPVNVCLEPHHQMLPVGVVMSIVGARVIVEGVEKHDPLNEGSILWMTETRTPLGLVDEIFGPVKNPYYVVRYNSENEVPSGIHGGTLISFVPEFANHVLNNKDLYKKGYDVSGVNDEEVSDESEFSDDEKEAEYKRMQRMAKRGTNDQNPGKRKNNRKKVSPKEGMVPAHPVATPTPLLDRGHCLPFSGIGQGLLGATTAVPPFPPTNSGPNLTTNGVWTNGTTPLQPQCALLPNGFPTNGISSLYPENTQISHQLPVPGIPFQQQLYSNHGFPSTSMFPGVQPNIFAQPMYAQGLVGQNQMPFGWSSPFPQIQPHISAGQQGFLSSGLQSEINSNLHSSSIPSNHHPRPQFQPGASSASRGRKTFHRGGRKGWRPAK